MATKKSNQQVHYRAWRAGRAVSLCSNDSGTTTATSWPRVTCLRCAAIRGNASREEG